MKERTPKKWKIPASNSVKKNLQTFLREKEREGEGDRRREREREKGRWRREE